MAEGPLDVVIVTFECRVLALACLRSLREHPPSRGYRAIVVDNASTDGTADAIEREHPEAVVLRLGENRGFSFATNTGIRLGSGDHVLALNPDTRVTEGALDTALDAAEEHDRVGVVGVRLVREDGSFDHAARRSFPTVLGALGHFTGVGRRAGAAPGLAQYRAPDVERGQVDAVNGAFMLLRRTAVEEVGLFDEGYWLYMEDLDLCWRLRERGWLTWYEPSATVVHVKGGSAGRYRRPAADIAFHRGMARFYRLHYAPGRNALANAAVYAGIGAKLGWSLARSAAGRRLGR